MNLSWRDLGTYQKIAAIKELQSLNFNQAEIANVLGVHRDTIHKFCGAYTITGWSQGAQLGNKNAEIHGLGRNTTMRLAQRIVQKDGRNLRRCEKCDLVNPLLNHSIHHKDEDRSNNHPTNLIVLRQSCHNKEHKRDRREDGTFK